MDWHNYEKYGNRVRQENDFREVKGVAADANNKG